MQLDLSYIQKSDFNDRNGYQFQPSHDIHESFGIFQMATHGISELTRELKYKEIGVKEFYEDIAYSVRQLNACIMLLNIDPIVRENALLRISLLKEKDGLNDLLRKIAPENIFQRLFAASYNQESASYITTSLNYRITNLYVIFRDSFNKKAERKREEYAEYSSSISNLLEEALTPKP